MGVGLVVFLDYLSLSGQTENLDERGQNKSWYFTLPAKIVFGILSVSFGLTIGYSRLFLGVHSLNQLIFGWSLGAWVAFNLEFIFKDSIIKHTEELLNQTDRDYLKVNLCAVTIMFFTLALEVLTYALLKDGIEKDNKESWNIQIVNKCG